MTPSQALEFVRKQGVVLEAGKGPVVSLAETEAGGPIRGSWWGHPKRQEIFALRRAVRASEDVCVCRLVAGKVTFVHRRLWPALVRVSPHVARHRLAMLRETHTGTGRHEVRSSPFPTWVPMEATRLSRELSVADAARSIGDWMLLSLR